MELKELKRGRYSLKGMLKFDTNKGEIQIQAKEALEIAYTLFDYCNVDFVTGTLFEVEERLLDDIDVERD